jgi:hypothetical protein
MVFSSPEDSKSDSTIAKPLTISNLSFHLVPYDVITEHILLRNKLWAEQQKRRKEF